MPVNQTPDIDCTRDFDGQKHLPESIPASTSNISVIFQENECQYRSLLCAFSEAEAHIKQAEIIDPAKNGLLIPSINELRYCSYHIVKALAATDQSSQASELSRAKRHCRRASYDALDLGVTTLLEELYLFTAVYVKKKLVISDVISNYSEMLATRNKAQDLLSVNYKDKDKHFESIAEMLDKLKEIKRTLESSTDELNAKLAQNRRPILIAGVSAFFGGVIATASILNYLKPEQVPTYSNAPVLSSPAATGIEVDQKTETKSGIQAQAELDISVQSALIK
ncbi:MAG: hypothetical protein ACMZ64_11630 [Oleiphilus sp.]